MPSLSRPACLPASPSLCLGCPRQRQRQQRHTESDRREGRDFSCACLFCLPLSSACPPLAAASLLIYKNYIHTYACVCVFVCVCVYIDENSFNAPHVLGRLPLLPSASSPFCHLFCAHFCARCLLLLRLHFTWLCCCCSLSPCLSFDPFYSAIRRVNRMPLFLIRFFTSLLVAAAAASTQTNKRSLSLTHLPTLAYSLSCLSALRFGFAIQLNKNKMCVPDDDVP